MKPKMTEAEIKGNAIRAAARKAAMAIYDAAQRERFAALAKELAALSTRVDEPGVA